MARPQRSLSAALVAVVARPACLLPGSGCSRGWTARRRPRPRPARRPPRHAHHQPDPGHRPAGWPVPTQKGRRHQLPGRRHRGHPAGGLAGRRRAGPAGRPGNRAGAGRARGRHRRAGGRPDGRRRGGLGGDQQRRAAPDRPAHRPADRAEPRPGQAPSPPAPAGSGRCAARAGARAGGSPASTRPAAGSSPASASRPARWPWGPDRAQCGSAAPRAGCGGWTRPVTGRPAPSGCRTVPGGAELAGKLVVASGVLWVTDPGPGVVRRVDLRSGTEDRWEADGRHLAVTPGGTVWATSDTRLLGLGGPQVRGPRRNLHELETDRITAMAAARRRWVLAGHGPGAVPRRSERPAPGIAPPVVYREQIPPDR